MGGLSGKRVERSKRRLPGEFADNDSITSDELRQFLLTKITAAGLCEELPAFQTLADCANLDAH
jgi:hypothetical protein